MKGMFGLLFISSLGLASCSDEPVTGTDLRFEEDGKMIVEDSYVIDAAGTKKITLRIRCDHDWKIVGTGQEWYTISPSQGEAGEATVTISCAVNESLDDRQDEISIQSLDWVGKKFTLLQKGIAYLNIEEGSRTVWEKADSGDEITILSNQEWSAQITEGQEWISIEGESSGGKNYEERTETLNLKFTANKGEERKAVLTLFDRNKNEETKVSVELAQGGIVLKPVIYEDKDFIKYGYQRVNGYQTNETFTFDVISDKGSDWQVKKGNDGDTWYKVEKGEPQDYSEPAQAATGRSLVMMSEGGITQLQITTVTVTMLDDNTTGKVRKADVLITVDSEVPVEKVIHFRQAYQPQVETSSFTNGNPGWNLLQGSVSAGSFGANTLITKTGYQAGTFRLYVTNYNSGGPFMDLYCEQPPVEQEHILTFGINNTAKPNKLWVFNSPWGFARPALADKLYNKGIKPELSKPCILEMKVEPSTRISDDGQEKTDFAMITWTYIKHDGTRQTCLTYYADDIDGSYIDKSSGEYCYTGASSTRYYVQYYRSPMTVRIGNSLNKSCQIEKFEYTPEINWEN